MTVSGEPTVFIVDDDTPFAESLAVLLRSAGLGSRHFASGVEFLRDFQPGTPGCLVLDVRMPGMGGLELLDRLRPIDAWPAVVMLTGYAEVPTAVRSLERGAVTYLQKTCAEDELLSAIRQAFDKDAEQRQARERRQLVEARLATLTIQEREVLDLVLASKANKTIAAALGISQRAVEDRRAKMMRKLQVDNLPDLVRFGLEAGITTGR
jgi:RNA polymerase sigma factor (sigma-70 family)